MCMQASISSMWAGGSAGVQHLLEVWCEDLKVEPHVRGIQLLCSSKPNLFQQSDKMSLPHAGHRRSCTLQS